MGFGGLLTSSLSVSLHSMRVLNAHMHAYNNILPPATIIEQPRSQSNPRSALHSSAVPPHHAPHYP